MSLKTTLAAYAERAEQALIHWLPDAHTPPSRLHEAMRYAALDGGNRVRPALVYASGELLGGPLEALDGPACAVELSHTYSLVHDDLPAMDDDDLRRGKPTCHIAYDEAMAILVGDALQTLAFQILARDPAITAPAAQRLAMIDTLAEASGSRGMVGGQVMDIEATGQALGLEALQIMHRHKTGALIRAAVRLGALSQDHPDPGQLAKLDNYAQAIGLAFQIQDDILDVVSDTATLGKPQGSDAEQDKSTYTALLGLDGARAKAKEVHAQAIASLTDFGEGADTLRQLADFIIERAS